MNLQSVNRVGKVNRMLKVLDQARPACLGEAGSLYERVLGKQAAQLPPQISALHCGDSSVRAAGWMRVDRGPGWLGRRTAMLLRLPRPGASVRVRLTINRSRGEERWVRQFGDGATVRSTQTMGRPGELVERFGLLAFVFTLEADGDVLRFRQQACQLRWGRFALAVPAVIAPRVHAEVAPAGSGLTVSVRIDHRGLGRLLAYDGVVRVEEGPR